jgi:putative transposase
MARIVVPELPHHVTQRGNRRQATFFDDADYAAYLALLGEWCRGCGVFVWAYCLMPNHVHLILVPATVEALARAVGEAHRRYTGGVNRRLGWTGHLWQGRFASYPLEGDYLVNAVRYVERNPVRAGLVEQAWDYPWSSAAARVLGRADPLLDRASLDGMVDDWRDFLAIDSPDADLAQFRLHTATGRPLGSEEFLRDLEAASGRVLLPQKRGPKPREAVEKATQTAIW